MKSPPRQGGVEVTNDMISIDARTPDLKGGDMENADRVVKNYGLGGAGLPPWFFADAGNTNRATADEMAGPTGKMLTSRQNTFKRMTVKILDYVIEQAVAHGVLSRGANLSYKLQVPDLRVKDMAAAATALQTVANAASIGEDRGWIRSETAANLFNHGDDADRRGSGHRRVRRGASRQDEPGREAAERSRSAGKSRGRVEEEKGTRGYAASNGCDAMSAQSQFAAKVQTLIKQAREFGPQVRDRVMTLLEEARRKVVGDLSNVDPGSFQGAQMRVLAKEIDAAMKKFGAEFADYVTSAQDGSFQLGMGQIDQPLDAAGIPTPSFAGVSESALSIAQGYTADLISGLSKDAAAKLNAAIQRAFLGGQSVSDIIAQVGRAIGGDKFTGLFSPIGARAETIALNEILRVHSIAGQARLEDLKAKVPGVKKQWLHIMASRMPRFSHIQASGQVQEVGDPFEVEGEELMYPRDPNGSPENTINCHCLLVPYMDASDLQPSAADLKTLKDAGLEISVTR